MSHKLLAFFLSELGILRVHCKACQGVIEMPVAKAALTCWFTCPICRESFDPMKTQQNGIAALASAIVRMQEASKFFDVEFVLPEGEKP